MRNLLCDKTFAQINDLIERINTAIDDNVRDITDVNTHSKKVIFKYHTFDGVEHSIYASNANAIAIVDDNVNAEMLTPAEDDTLYVFGDKNGITIHAVAPAETAHHSWFNDSITVDHLNDDIFYRIECDNTYDDAEGSVDQNFVMYEIGGLKAGRAYTLNITARASIINYDANDLKLVVLDDDGTTVITQQALTKDTSPHDYTVTFTAPDTMVYLKFVLAAIDDFSGSSIDREEFVISKFLFTGMDIGIIDLKFYNNGQWYSVGAGGGSSNVELIEISKADYDALPQSAKDDPNKAYFVYNYPSGGGGGGGASALSELSDVDISNPSDGQVLKYNGTSHAWENATGGGGSANIVEMTKTQYRSITPAQDTVYFVYDEGQSGYTFGISNQGATYAYDSLPSDTAEIAVLTSLNNTVYAGFFFDVNTRVATAMTDDEMTTFATQLSMSVGTGTTMTISQNTNTPNCNWRNGGNYDTFYLDATSLSNVGIKCNYSGCYTHLFYTDYIYNGNAIYLNGRQYAKMM